MELLMDLPMDLVLRQNRMVFMCGKLNLFRFLGKNFGLHSSFAILP